MSIRITGEDPSPRRSPTPTPPPGFGFLGAGIADPSKPGSVLTAVGVLAAIVAVHEAGHFAAARLQGIRVTRFAVGFGPTIWKYQVGWGVG